MGPTGIAPVLQVHPSRRCNLACAHCYSSSGPTVREELRLELLFGCLEDAASLGYRQLAVSGGEPLLYRSLPELLAQARRLGMTTTVTTNGMLATARRWAPLAQLVDVVAVSIDGTPAEHDLIRRRQGAFAAALANLAVIRDSGVPFGLIFTLTQFNVDSLAFVVELAAGFGARGVQVHPLTLHGRARTGLPRDRPDAIELVAALAEAARLGRMHGVAVHVDALTGDQIRAYRDRLVPVRPVRCLTDTARTLVVEADGSVLPMTHDVSRSLALGSLAIAPLARLAAEWIEDGRGDRLAAACEATWAELASDNTPAGVYWYDEVAARTHERASAERARTMRDASRLRGAAYSRHLP